MVNSDGIKVVTTWVSEKRVEAEELPGSTESRWTVLPPLSK